MNRIWLSPPHIGDRELKYVQEAFVTNWIAPVGPHISKFEAELQKYMGVDVFVTALSSGTAAIHLALVLAGVGKGDEVICSTFTFSGSCNPIVYVGGTPVFVDSEPETWNMDPELLRLAIDDRIEKTGKKPKAIIVVHLYGMPAKMQEICEIAGHYEIPLIEDAAEALGSEYRGRKCGTMGNFGILSFNGNKIITTSGGGALICQDSAASEKARFLATQARDPAPHYEHSEVGYNYRMSNVCAGIGCGQLEVLNDRIESRRKVFNFYQERLTHYGINFQREPDAFFSNRWLTTIVLPKATSPHDLRIALEKANIESRPLWKPMHMQPVFSGCLVYENGVASRLFQTGLCLPSGSSLTLEDMERIHRVIIDVVTG